VIFAMTMCALTGRLIAKHFIGTRSALRSAASFNYTLHSCIHQKRRFLTGLLEKAVRLEPIL
jgi:hypothetical protein